MHSCACVHTPRTPVRTRATQTRTLAFKGYPTQLWFEARVFAWCLCESTSTRANVFLSYVICTLHGLIVGHPSHFPVTWLRPAIPVTWRPVISSSPASCLQSQSVAPRCNERTKHPVSARPALASAHNAGVQWEAWEASRLPAQEQGSRDGFRICCCKQSKQKQIS